jgi:hypothetical protein
MLSNLLFIMVMAATPLPKISVINLSLSDKGSVARINTSIAVLPTIVLSTQGEFSDKKKKSLVSILKTLGKFPSTLATGILKKQLVEKKLNKIVVLTSSGIYLVSSHGVKGPWKIPGVRSALPIEFMRKLNNLNSAKTKKGSGKSKIKHVAWWKNWIFWTGVTIITGSILTFSMLNQEPDRVEIHLTYP